MSVLAVQVVRQLRGRSRPLLMHCEQDFLYVVKFPVNPENSRLLTNELFCSRIAGLAQLPVADCAVVTVPTLVMMNGLALRGSSVEALGLASNDYFGSLCVGAANGQATFEFLPTTHLAEATAGNAFAAMFAFDKWCANLEPRKALFHRGTNDRRWCATFINHSGSFSRCQWKYVDSSGSSTFANKDVYRTVSGWDSFEPFLTRLVTMQRDDIWKAACETPEAWYDGERAKLEELVDTLILRQTKIRDLVLRAKSSDPSLFPGWLCRSYPSLLPVKDSGAYNNWPSLFCI